MSANKVHPAQQFSAPSSIQHGVALKDLMERKLILLIGQSLQAIVPEFKLPQFRAQAERGLDSLELKDRAMNIAHAMAAQLPADFDQAAPFLIKSFGPPLVLTEGNGLAPFFYLPHSQLIAEYGVSKFESGMATNYEITKRFTAEFSIRPFLIAHRSKCLKLLKRWAKDSNPHVRRLVSEGTRPRLPWAMRLPDFQDDPSHTLSLLEALKDDPELYVRRSVANHLGDIAKDHPEFAFDVCDVWLNQRNESFNENRCWIVRHAVRLPAKKGHPRAINLRELASRTRGGNSN